MRKNWLASIGTVALIAAILLVSVVGCGSPKDPQSTEPADENGVVIQDYKYQPEVITIQKGESVTWTNRDSVQHTATGKSFDSGLLSKGRSYTREFTETGTFDYTCTPHPYMQGKVIVK